MSSRAPHFPRVVPLTLSAIAAGTLAPLFGQEISSSVPGRLETAVDSRIVPRNGARRDDLADRKRSEELLMGIAISAAYSDNIYLSAKNVESDFVVKVSPGITWKKGDKSQGEGGYLSIAYQPSLVSYADNSSNDRVDHQASWEVGWQGKAISYAYTGSYAQLGDATADTGTLTDRTESMNEGRIAWSLREKISLEVAVGQKSTTYDSAAFADSGLTYGEVALRYAYSPKTRLSATYKHGRFEVDGAGDQMVHRTSARLEWKPTRKIAVDLDLGAEHRSFDGGSETSPVVEARIGWMPRQGTEIYLNGYRREQASAFLPGQNYTEGGISLGIVQKLGDKWTARLEGGLEEASYSRVSGVGPAGRVDKIHFIRPSVEYRLTDDFSMGLYYRYSQNDSNSPLFGYRNHTAGVEMGYTF